MSSIATTRIEYRFRKQHQITSRTDLIEKKFCSKFEECLTNGKIFNGRNHSLLRQIKVFCKLISLTCSRSKQKSFPYVDELWF